MGRANMERNSWEPIHDLPAGWQGDELWVDRDDWDELEPAPAWEDLWDAFELDDEMAEPQPQYGDFWGEPDEEEPA